MRALKKEDNKIINGLRLYYNFIREFTYGTKWENISSRGNRIMELNGWMGYPEHSLGEYVKK